MPDTCLCFSILKLHCYGNTPYRWWNPADTESVAAHKHFVSATDQCLVVLAAAVIYRCPSCRNNAAPLTDT